MNKKLLIVAIVLVVGLVGWMFLRNKKGIAVDGPTNPGPPRTPFVSLKPTFLGPPETVSPSPVVSNMVIYNDSGYTPNTITIKKGETVVWKNESSNPMWTASAVHPTHKGYPGTDIANCGTSAGSNQFDACAGVASGQSWSFKFDNIGTWGYHNHLKASQWGKVVVE